MTSGKPFRPFILAMFLGLGAHGAGAVDPSPSAQRAFEPIDFDSLETTGVFSPKPVKIKGYLLKASGESKAPGAVLAPACQGLLTPDGSQINPNYRKMAYHLNAMGVTVLLIDGFNPRGFKEICSQSGKTRSIDNVTRLKDAFGGLAYLRSRSDVLADRIFLVSWGATGSLQAMNQASPYRELAGTGFAGAVMFYPECDKMDNRFAPYAPIQVFVGEKDEWNPASACLQLAKRQEAGSASFDIKIYPDTYHAFDKPMPPRLYTGNPGLGPVMVGSNPAATADALKTTTAFIARVLEASGRRQADPQ